MNIFKKFILEYKYKKKKFKFIGENSNYKQFNSKFISSQNITLCKNSKVLDYAYFDGSGGIEIGECTIIAPKCTILTSNHNYDEDTIEFLPFNNEMISKEVIIEKYCWIGREVLITPGTIIGEGSIVAAGSVVTKNVEPYSIVGGNPAKLIKKRDSQKIKKLISENKCWNDPNMNKDPKKLFKKVELK